MFFTFVCVCVCRGIFVPHHVWRSKNNLGSQFSLGLRDGTKLPGLVVDAFIP